MAYCFLLLVSAIVALCLYFLIISRPVYNATKRPHHYTSNLYDSDGKLGYKLKSNATGYFVWSYGDSVLIETDENGFRKTPYGKRIGGGLLFLGDSFTFGEELAAAESFPFKIGMVMGRRVYNAAVSGYGYAQMIYQAQNLIDELDPEFIVVQLSPWLAERATSPYMPAPFFKVPVIHLSEDGALIDPYFESPVFELSQDDLLNKYRRSEASFSDFLSFVWHFSGPVYWAQLKGQFSLINEPVSVANESFATKWTLQQLKELAAGRRLILVIMGFTGDEIGSLQREYDITLDQANIEHIDMDSIMYAQPGISSLDDFERAYNFWHGNPPELIDYHYNEHAHQLITNAVLQQIAPTPLDTLTVE